MPSPSNTIQWTWAGSPPSTGPTPAPPTAAGLRLISTGTGHTALLNLMYQPSEHARQVLADETAQVLGAATLSLSTDGPSVRRYQAFAGQLRAASEAVTEAQNALNALRVEQAAASATPTPGAGRTLRLLAKRIVEATETLHDAEAERSAVRVAANKARHAAEQELVGKYQQQAGVAASCLAIRRRALEQELLSQVGRLVTQLLAVDAALHRARCGSMLQPREISHLLDSLPIVETADTAGSAEPAADAQASPDAGSDGAAQLAVPAPSR